MSELVPAVIGVVGALAGTVVGVTIQRRHQRAALLQDARLALYADVFIELASSERWMARMTGGASDYDPIQVQQNSPPDLGSISGRVLLLSTPPTRQAWQEYLDALHDMRWCVSEMSAYGKSLPPDIPTLVRLRSAVEAAYRAVRVEAGLKADT